MSSLSLSLRFAGYVGALFVVLGAYAPFWPVFLESRGLNVAQIGAVMAATSWVKVAGVPFWGRIADPPGRGRPTIILLALLATIVFSSLFWLEGYLPILLAHIVQGFVFTSLVPLGDSQILGAARERGIDYGRIRAIGSATFIGGSLAGGWLIVLPDRDWYLLLVVAPLLVTAAMAWSLPRRPRDRTPQVPMRYGALLRNKPFLALLLIAGSLQGSHGAFYVISALAWQAEGLSAAQIAWLWAIGVLAEILLLTFGKQLLRRIHPAWLLVIGGVGGILRWIITASTSAIAPLVFAQMLHALSFALVHLAAVTLIARLVPAERMASGQSLYVAVQSGLFLSVSMALAGLLYEQQGASTAYSAMLVFSLFGVAAGCLLRPRMMAAAPQPVP